MKGRKTKERYAWVRCRYGQLVFNPIRKLLEKLVEHVSKGYWRVRELECFSSNPHNSCFRIVPGSVVSWHFWVAWCSGRTYSKDPSRFSERVTASYQPINSLLLLTSEIEHRERVELMTFLKLWYYKNRNIQYYK